MEIKETKLRNMYRDEEGIFYSTVPMRYMKWREEKIKELIEQEGFVKIIRDDEAVI